MPPPYGDEATAGVGGGSELRRYWEILRARFRVVLAVWVTVVAGVALGTWLQTPVYRATGTMEVRDQGAEVVPVESLFQLARVPDQHLSTQHGILTSAALARRVIAELGLPPETSTNGAVAPSEGALEHAVADFRNRLTVERVQDSRLIRVSFDSPDPELSARVVNSIFSNYVRLRQDAGAAAVEGLSRQVAEARSQLADSERQLQEFVVENELSLVDGGGGDTENLVLARLRQLQAQLTQAEVELYQHEARQRQLTQAGVDALDSPVLRSLSVPLAELEGEYARLRTTFTDSFPRTREVRRQIEVLRAEVARERQRIGAEANQDFRTASGRVQLLRNAVDEQNALAERLAGMTAEYGIIRREVEGQQVLYAMLQQKEKEAGVSAAMAATEVALFDPAVAPGAPLRPQPARNVLLGVVVGLLLGVGLAFVRDYTDPRLRRIDEVGTMEAPVLALIPSARGLGNGGGLRLSGRNLSGLLTSGGNGHRSHERWARIDRDGGDRSELAEAFGGLRTSLLFRSMGGALPRSLLVTSVGAGDGKTTVSMNLGISLARLRRKVLLVDADMRRPSLHHALEAGGGPGLAEALAGGVDWRSLVRATRTPGLDLLPAGSADQSPTELLSSEGMAAFVEQAGAAYDFVLFDAPALLVNVADARILSHLTEGVILVARAGVTPREVLRGLVDSTPNLVGVVLNDVDRFRLPFYYHEYGPGRESGESVGRRSGEVEREPGTPLDVRS